METTQKKGMSKGCMVALIVGGVLLVIVIIIVALGAVYWEDLKRLPAKQAITVMKDSLAENPVEGVDTVRFNSLADGFVEKLNSKDELDPQVYSSLLLEIQTVVSDEEFDSTEVRQISEGIIRLFPDLAYPESHMEVPVDSLMEDSTAYTDSL